MKERKPQGYWQSLDNIVFESYKCKEEHKLVSLPSQRGLKELGKHQLNQGIKNVGGYHLIRAILGEQPKRRKAGTWQSLSAVLEESYYFMKQYGFEELPSQPAMRKLGYSSLAHTIYRFGGFPKIRELLRGYVPSDDETSDKRNDKRHDEFHPHEELVATLDEARALKAEHGLDTLPSHKKLRKMGYVDLSNAILREGGFRRFRLLLGEKQIRRPTGLWQDVEYAVREAHRLMQSLDLKSLPGEPRLRDLNSSLATAITRYHDGFPAFRIKLGEYEQELAVLKEIVEELAE